MSKKLFPIHLGFDVDGETLWLTRDPANAKKPVQLSQGAYGPLEGVPRILKLLKKYGIKATFFVPGETAERYPDMVKRIDDEGHELGNHSWTHTHPHKFTERAAELDELARSNDLLKKLTGKVPTGYRSPAFEFSAFTTSVLEELGFKWESNFMQTDSVHLMKVFDHQTDIVDIPVSWMLDDAAHWLYSVSLVGKAMQPLSTVEDYWKREFQVLHQEFTEDEDGSKKNLVYSLTLHPQIIGTPARATVLENLIKFMNGFPNVVYLTGSQICENFHRENAVK